VKPPIIIGGNPRSGTTFLAALLGAHRDIIVTSEINPDAAELACQMLHRLTLYMDQVPSRKRIWDRNRGGLMVEIWKSVTSAALMREKAVNSRVGHKTPGAEHRFEDYVEIFRPVQPKLVYCLRDGVRVMRSLVNMPWREVSLAERLALYKQSLETYEALQRKYPKDVLLFQVDKIAREPDQRRTQVQEVFDFIGEPMDASAHRFVDEWPAQNTMSAVTGKSGGRELSGQEMELLASDDVFTSLQRRYGYDALAGSGATPWSPSTWTGLRFVPGADDPSIWTVPQHARRTSVEVRAPDCIAVRCTLDEGGRFYLSTGRTALSGPAEPEARWPIDAYSPHELHVDMKVVRGAPTVHIWVLQYDQRSRVADGRLQLRPGKNVLKFVPAPNAESLRIAFRFARRGEVELGPMSAFVVSR
jgi:hypothetical protein